MVQIQGYVGPQTAASGSTTTGFRQDKTGSQVSALGRGNFAEQTYNGLVYSAFIPPGTGQAPGTAIGTTAAFTLANPATSVKNLVILWIATGYISGTLGAGVLALLAHFLSTGAITAPTGGTAITPTNGLINSTAGSGSVANCRFNNTVPATGLMIRAIASLDASLATSVVGPYQVIDPVNGAVIVAPGAAVSVQGIAAAGTSPLITVGMTWAEEPV